MSIYLLGFFSLFFLTKINNDEKIEMKEKTKILFYELFIGLNEFFVVIFVFFLFFSPQIRKWTNNREGIFTLSICLK